MSNGPEFFQTIMGKRFYEGTAPKIAKSLENIAVQLERLNSNLEKMEAVDDEMLDFVFGDDFKDDEVQYAFNDIPWSDNEMYRLDYSSGDTAVLLRIYDDGSANLKYSNREHFIYSKSKEYAIEECSRFLVRNGIEHMIEPRVELTNPNR